MVFISLPRANPVARGVDPKGVHAFLDAIEQASMELHSFMLYRHDAVVFEAFWKPYSPERRHVQHSATKSWTALAVGIAIDEGRLDLGDAVVGFFPEHRPPVVSANLAAMTVEDLLTMRSGHQTGISGGEWRTLSESWIRAFLQEEVQHPPGQQFIYSSASSYMLSAIVSRVTGLTLHEFLHDRVFRHLNMDDVHWDLSPEGFNTGGNGLRCRLEDALKFAVLHLNRGAWNGRQIISEGWVSKATINHVGHAWFGAFDGKRFLPRDAAAAEEEKRAGYGYQWWMAEGGGYQALGLYGQQCVVFPKEGAVLAFTGGLLPAQDDHLSALIVEHLLPALGAKDRGDSASATALAERAEDAKLALVDVPVPAPSSNPLRKAVFEMDANDDHIAEIGFEFTDETCVFSLKDDRGVHAIRVGLDEAREGQTSMTGGYLHHQYEFLALRVLAQGYWISDRKFVMVWRFVETAFCDRVVCTVDGDTIAFDRSVNTNAGALRRPQIRGVLNDASYPPQTASSAVPVGQ